jgi:tRNA modification GTPase
LAIVACSTPPGVSGIAVVRISGEDAIKNVSTFVKDSPLNKTRPVSKVCFLVDRDGEIFDEVIITSYIGPNSYTGENLVEISCHGNPKIVSKIIDLSVEAGSRLAEAGEFTKTAFLNGKLDLSEAEAVASVIHSLSLAGVKAGIKNLRGGLSKEIYSIKSSLISIVANLEFNLDISEEDLQPNLLKNSEKTILETIKKLDVCILSFEETKMFQSGASVVILGPPNAGKSTLFNYLVNKDQSIVTDIEGTTRDVIEKNININGLPILLKDTAGIRESGDDVEKIGVERSFVEAKDADLTIILNDRGLSFESVKHIHVFNKSDIKSPNKKYDISVSAKTGKNVKKLKEIIYNSLISDKTKTDTLLTSKRQYNAIKSALKHIKDAYSLLVAEDSIELLVEDINRSIGFLDSITKKTTKDDVLDAVFSSFCVGK